MAQASSLGACVFVCVGCGKLPTIQDVVAPAPMVSQPGAGTERKVSVQSNDNIQADSRLEPEDTALVHSLIGHSIVAAEWLDSNHNNDWCEHEIALLTLDDGRVIEFSGWGYDASGASVRLLKAAGS